MYKRQVLFTDYKGAITEQYVLQQLKSVKGLNIYYWSSDTSKGELEMCIRDRDKFVTLNTEGNHKEVQESRRHSTVVDETADVTDLAFLHFLLKLGDEVGTDVYKRQPYN